MAHLSDLPPELVLCILRLSDVATILRVSETCRFLHNVVFDKSCWIDVVRDLQRRGIIDDPERVHEFSAEDLVQLVRRASLGPPSWIPSINPEPKGHSTLKSTQSTVPVPDPSAYWLSAKLLPGGRHILINSGGELSCNNVAEGACIWRYKSLLPGNPSEIRVLEFHFANEVGESGQHTILICLEGEHGDYVDVVELDVAMGSHRVLLSARVPVSDTMSNGILCNPVVCGTLAAVGIHPDRSLYLIVDLAQQLAFILEFQFDCRDDERDPDNAQQLFLLDLAPGYIVVRARSLSGTEEHLHIISAEIAFRRYGRELPPLNARIPYAKTSKYYNVAQLGSNEFKEAILITQVITETSLPDSYECNRVMQYIENTLGPDAAAYGALRVFADPLRDDVFRIWVYISATRIEREDSGRRYRSGLRISYQAPHSQDDDWFTGYGVDGLLCLYELDVSVLPAQKPRLREVRRGPAPAAVVCSGLTSSGHVTVMASSTLEIYPPFALLPVPMRWEVDSQQDPETGRAERWNANVAAYTGDVTLANRRAIVVHRFA
ncbi:F-box domain-containing protein [Mycena chlorophos]|uniref:F-box domain-containing protein n=1 Tax=Mycena chlorophos TaxID=658473 RepID=A0A8H6TAI4_MYCCL|nr:F-box domain-containing protein [Mycena chlorophos]